MKNHWMTSLCVAVTFCFGCVEIGAENEFDEEAAYDDEATSEAEQALAMPHFSGVFVDPAGNRIAGATMKINGVASITDAGGKYSRSAAISTKGYQISTTVPGFVPFHETVLTGRDNAIHILRPLETQIIDPTINTTITSSRGVQVMIPAYSLVEPKGTVVMERVHVGIASLDPHEMPGDFTGRNEAGQTVAIESVGALFVQATIARTGVGLQLKIGATATVTVPLPSAVGTMPSCVDQGSCKLALWRFDMDSGNWVEKNANRTFTAQSTTFVMTRGTNGLVDNGGLGMWSVDIETSPSACTIVQFVGIPRDCYRPPGTPSNSPDPGLALNVELPYSSAPFVRVQSDQVTSSQSFVALYNLTPNALQNIGVTFPAGAPAYCAANLNIVSDAAPAVGYPNYFPTGGMTRFNSGASRGGAGIPLAVGTTNAITLADVAATPPRDPCNSRVMVTSHNTPAPNLKYAMTWKLLHDAQNGSDTYARPGTDLKTNPYQGDTWTRNELPVLCINKTPLLPDPGASVIGSPHQTPGGAWRNTWSGGMLAVTTPVRGSSLTSLATANDLCARQFGAGYRMAEFHDGDPRLWSGWDFWGQVYGANLTPFQDTRFWVYIDDQAANPW